MNEVLIYKTFSFLFLVFLVIAWNFAFKGKTCLSIYSNVSILIVGAIANWFYPSGAFACEECLATYAAPYFILPILIFFLILGLTKFVRRFISNADSTR